MDYDRKLVAKRLVEDIEARASAIDPILSEIDLVIFSGDIAFSGNKAEFELARECLLEPVRALLARSRGIAGEAIPIYCVPGNHDIQRPGFKSIPSKIKKSMLSGDASVVEKLLQGSLNVRHINEPLSNFYNFARKFSNEYVEDRLYFVSELEKGGYKIRIACLNSSWLSARFRIGDLNHKPTRGDVWDRGILRVSDAQLNEAIDNLRGADLAIAVMHHPLHWLDETEQAKAEQAIGRGCHVFLHGHEHRPNMNRVSNAFGDVVVIPAGASYNRRNADDPRCTNAYNFCSVDLERGVGTIFHRVWSEDVKVGWQADERFWANGKSQFFIQKKQDAGQQRVARRALNQLSKNFLRHIYKRPAISHKIEMRHEVEHIDGEMFVRAYFKIKVDLYEGEPERYPISSLVNPRIVKHANPKVRQEAHKVHNLLPKSDGLVWNEDRTRCEGYLDLGRRDQEIEWDFEMLETTDGMYYFNILRFTEKVEFTLKKAPGFEYEDLPFGGFPRLESSNNRVLEAETWNTNKREPVMPNQGLILQWYQKPRTVD
jgi:predicted phosphodiesterase